MTKRRWRAVRIGGVLIALVYGVSTLVHTPSDADMLARFRSHRAIFDQLLQMLVDDNRDMWIDSTDRS